MSDHKPNGSKLEKSPDATSQDFNYLVQVCDNIKNPNISTANKSSAKDNEIESNLELEKGHHTVDKGEQQMKEEEEESKAWQSMVENGRDFFPRHYRTNEDDPLINDEEEFSFDDDDDDDDDDEISCEESGENSIVSQEDITDDKDDLTGNEKNPQFSTNTEKHSNFKNIPVEGAAGDDWFSYNEWNQNDTTQGAKKKSSALNNSFAFLKIQNHGSNVKPAKSISSLPVFQSRVPLTKKESKFERENKSADEFECQSSTPTSDLQKDHSLITSLPQIIPKTHSLNVGIFSISKQEHLPPENKSYSSQDKMDLTTSQGTQSTAFISAGPKLPPAQSHRRKLTRTELLCISIISYFVVSSTFSSLDDQGLNGLRGSVKSKIVSSGLSNVGQDMQDGQIGQMRDDNMSQQLQHQFQFEQSQLQQQSSISNTWTGFHQTQSDTQPMYSAQNDGNGNLPQTQLHQNGLSEFSEGQSQHQTQEQHWQQQHVTAPHPHLWEDADIARADDDMISIMGHKQLDRNPQNDESDPQHNHQEQQMVYGDKQSEQSKQLENVKEDKEPMSLSTVPLTGGLRDELRPIDDTLDAQEGDISIFLLVPPLSHETQSVKDVVDTCFDLTRAEVNGPSGAHRIEHTSTQSQSQEEDIIFTSNLFELSHLLNPDSPIHKRGLMFTFLMHPVERSALLFEYLKSATHELTFDSNLSTMSLLEYARDRVHSNNSATTLNESNFLVRSFAQVPMDVPLHGGHVAHAVQVFRRYCLLGLMENEEMFFESWRRIQKFYGWKGEEKCVKMFLPPLSQSRITEDSEEYRLLAKLNEYDMIFYENIKSVFEEQGKLSIFDNL